MGRGTGYSLGSRKAQVIRRILAVRNRIAYNDSTKEKEAAHMKLIFRILPITLPIDLFTFFDYALRVISAA